MILFAFTVLTVWAVYSAYCWLFWRSRPVKDRVVLITGGARGIGRNMALKMAKQGAKIVLWDMSVEALEEAKKLITAAGAECRTYTVDVTDRERVYATAAEVGRVDVLVNNAGIVTGKPLLECPDELMEKTVQVNTIAHFWTIKAFLPGMLERDDGNIVTVASAAGLVGTAGLIDYCASKFGAVGTAEALYLELRKRRTKVRATMVCPFFINTGPGGLFDGAKTKWPSLLPILEEDYVAGRIVTAIKRGDPKVVMPFLVELSMVLKVLPMTWLAWLAEFLGTSDSMNDFKGRKEKTA